MSSGASGSSSSDSEPHHIRSGVVSTVHIARQSVWRDSQSGRDQVKREDMRSSRSHTGGQAHMLTEADEQLDYNEELPSLKRDVFIHTKHIKSRPREPHSSSPREEGEEDSDYDEEDDGTPDTSGHEAKRSHRIPISSRDREEGEASSDDDQRKREVTIKQSSIKAELLAFDEAEYRHRLHERHERRQRERLIVAPPKEGSYGRELPDRTRVQGIAGTDTRKPIHSASHEDERGSRKRLIRPSPGDIEYLQRNKEPFYDVDEPYRKKLSSRKRSEKQEPLADTEESMQPIHRSQSASVIPYEQSNVTMETSSSARHRTKSKKSKQTVAESGKTKHGKKTKRMASSTTDVVMDYAAWESYVYGNNSSVTTSHIHSELIRTSPHSASLSSSSSTTSPVRHGDVKQSILYTEPTGHVRSHHRIKRDVRESAPTPERGPSKLLLDTDLEKRPRRSEKHKSRHRSSASKRRHRSKEARRLSPRASGSEIDPNGMKRPHSKSRQSRDRLPSVESSPDVAPKKSRGHLSSAPVEDQKRGSVSRSSSSSSSSSEAGAAAADGVVEDVDNVKDAADKSLPSDQTEPLKKEVRAGRFQHYRLYSTSSSSDEERNAITVAGENGMGGEGDLPRQRSTLFDITTPAELYETLENRPPRAPSKPYYFPSIQGCRSVEEFECLNRIEEGTYGVVYRARDKKTNEIVALKRLKMEKERDGFPITSLREINTLMKAQHENIVTVREVVVGSNMDKIYLVMDYVEHDLKSLMEIMNGPFSVGEVKCLLSQLLKAVRHLHDNWIIHRDLKTSNLLLSHQGILKVGDFGLAREYGSPLEHYTEVVVTLWYRAPELLLGTKLYTCPIDLWSVGCIFAEFLLQRALFPGKSELDELNMIFTNLGTPNERIWPGVMQLPGMKKCTFTEHPYNQLRRRFTEKQISDQGFDLLNSFLTYCPEKRITADKALTHAYFNERPRAIHPSMFPSWPARSEGGVAARKQASPRPPAGGGALAAAAAAIAAAAGQKSRIAQPAPPMGGQRFYSTMRGDSRPGTFVGSGDTVSSSVDKGFLLRF